MKVAVVGSRSVYVKDLESYLPQDTTEIVSGGARGVDTCAKNYALEKGIKLTEFLPEYGKYGRRAPIIRNMKIVEHADMVFAFWDGASRGTKFIIDYARQKGVPIKVVIKTKSRINTAII